MKQNGTYKYRCKAKTAAVLALLTLSLSITGCGDRVNSIISSIRGEKTGEASTAVTAAASEEAAGEGVTGPAPALADDNTALSAGEQTDNTEGSVLNICCWDETLEDIFVSYYPDYEDNGDGTGKIGSVRVNWIMSEDESDYMEQVSRYLLGADRLADDEKIDLFLASENDLSIYVSSSYALDVKGTLGLTDAELDDQYPFTQQPATDEDGILKAVTYKAAPGVFVYRRSIAREVLGSDDPAVVQQAVADWDAFMATAGKMKKGGYYMLSGYLDAYSPYRCAAKTHWERDGKLQIDSTFTQWVTFTKLMTDSGYHHGTLMGDDRWVSDQGPKGKVFGFFRAAEDIDSRMAAYSLASAAQPKEGNGIYGDYAVCAGPQPFTRGGIWILAAKGTDNLTLDAQIMRKLTCDSSVLQEIAQGENTPVNSVSGMKVMAQGSFANAFLGGQNPYEVYESVCSRISLIGAGKYDRRIGDSYRDRMMPYFTGEEELDEAQDDFYSYVETTYPELSVE